MLQYTQLRKVTAVVFLILMTGNVLAPLGMYARPYLVKRANGDYKAVWTGGFEEKKAERESLGRNLTKSIGDKRKGKAVSSIINSSDKISAETKYQLNDEEQPLDQKKESKYFTNQDETLNQPNASGVVQAFNTITLDPGFETLTGGEFTAQIIWQVAQSNVPAPSSSTGNANTDINWVMATTYDPAGNPIGESKKFFDQSGRPLQDQSKVKYRKDASTVYTHVFATQPLYDAYGRPAASTLGAPIDNSAFAYKSNFVQNASNSVYDYKNFDRYKPTTTETDKTNSPDPLGTAPGTLGWYYSTSNTWEPYTAVTSYPYSRQSFYRDGTGNVKKSAGVGEVFKMGSTHEGSSYVTPVINELNEYVSIRNKYFSSSEFGELPTSLLNKAIQTISRDANGREAIALQDKDGKTVMVARPGSELSVSNSTVLKPAYTYSFNGSDIGTAKNLKITGTGNIKLYESQNGGSSYTELYSGAPSSYTSPSSLPHLYKIESDQAFAVSYDAAMGTDPDRLVCKNCPSQAGDNSIYYFKLLASATVTVTGGSFTLYDMNTEQSVSFTSGSSLAAGYYKLVNAGTTPITLGYSNNYADISYSFYNHLGQLVATIAPEGVKKLHGSGINNYATKSDIPFVSLNEYDVQGRVVKSISTDGGMSEMVYRKDGKIRFSQNAVQRSTGAYSYTNYDQYGRPFESGQYDGSSVAFNSTSMSNILENIGTNDGLSSGTKTDVVQTIYDIEDNTHGQSGYNQDPFYLRGGVSTTKKYSSIVNNNPGSSNIVSQTWYSYDEEGKAVWQIQYINGLGYKTTDFTYDNMSRLVKRVYQKNTSSETFAHYYEYDPSTQNLWRVYTAVTNNTSTPSISNLNGWTLQANYIYYLHGPLKRIELATNVQGIDFTYTVDGKLKAINNADNTKDPGGDGSNSFSADAFGMVLDYYALDYINGRSGVQLNGVNTSSITADSYSGQIKAMTWFSLKPAGSGASNSPTTYVYNYDDKYQFIESTWGNGINFNNIPATFTTTGLNKEKVKNPSTGVPAYDANGNILFLQRANSSGTPTDNFTYNYLNTATNSGSNTNYNTNKLKSITNGGSNYAEYEYDNLGQLSKEINYENGKTRYVKYDVTGKVVCVTTDAAFTQKLFEFVYDETGNRIIKRLYNTSNQLIQNIYYVGDVIYAQTVSGGVPGSIAVQEYEIDGGVSGRLGVYYRQGDTYAYALTDHLGNTRAVVTKNGSSSTVTAYTDYYPYGMVISSYDPNNYRYGYQGKYAERDETGWNAFDLRMYDSRIARWLQFDPKEQFFSPYVGMGSDPVNSTDPDGGSTDDWVEKDGQMMYDNRVIDQKTATELYGQGAIYREIGYKYTARSGAEIELGDYGFFKRNGVILLSPDLAQDALNNMQSQIDDIKKSYAISGAIGGFISTDTAIPDPSDAAWPKWVAYAVAGGAAIYYINKMTKEIEGIKKKLGGPQGVQYSLRALTPGDYPCYTCMFGTMRLNPGDIWKYGQTINPGTRYSETFKNGLGVEQVDEYFGNQVEIKIQEKVKIYGYFLAYGHLPPGNRIFR